jgi:serine/threonine-protein kinase
MAELSKLGRYELRRVLGKGAMGVVYEGYDPVLSRRVAVKTILKSVALDDETERSYAERFVREAKAVARLNHPHIVQVHDFGVENEVAYLVMEFIQGRELRSHFAAGEHFDAAECVRVMGELLDALDFAHEAGVIHRDIKPANVMIDAQRRVKLADFGVARVQDSERSAAGTMVGTPAFMSPEQISGGKIDRRTDIFSAGTILYQLLTGEQPFKGEGAWTVAKQIMQDDPPRPSSIAAALSPAFDPIVHKALAKKPADRFTTARDFAAALRGGLASPSDAAPIVMPKAKPKAERAGEAEVEFWRSIQNSTDPAEFDVYLEEFPLGTYAQLARLKIAKLREPIEAARKAAEEKARLEAEEQARKEAEERARKEAEENAIREALEKSKREAAEKARREADERARQAALAKRRQQEEAARAARAAADEDATVAIGTPAASVPPDAKKASFAIPAIAAVALIAAGVAAYLILGRTPAPVTVATAPTAPAEKPVSAKLETAAIDEAKIRRETEERVRKEFVDKAALEKTVAEKLAAERAAAEKAAAAKSAAEKATADKVAEKATADRVAAEKAAAARSAADKATAEKAGVERIAAEKAAAGKAAAEKLATEKASAEKLAVEKAAADKSAAAKAAAAAKPGWPAVGDRWVYEVREVNRPEKRYQATVEVRSIAPASISETFRWPGGASDSTHGATPYLLGAAPGVATFAPYLRAFQDIGGSERWGNLDFKNLWNCTVNPSVSCSAKARVVGREKVAVKAGSFNAWKIEVELYQKALGMPATAGGSGFVYFTFWYAEDARRFVKSLSRIDGYWMMPAIEAELVSYTPAGPR